MTDQVEEITVNKQVKDSVSIDLFNNVTKLGLTVSITNGPLVDAFDMVDSLGAENYVDINELAESVDNVIEENDDIEDVVNTVATDNINYYRNLLDVTRNYINPIISEVTESSLAKLDRLKAQDLSNFEIKEAFKPNYLLGYLNGIERFADSKIYDEGISVKVKCGHVEDFNDILIDLKDDTLTNDLMKFTNTGIVNDVFNQVYSELFEHEVGIISLGRYFVDDINQTGFAKAIAAFFISSILLSREPIKGSLGSVEDYKNFLSLIRGQAAFVINNHLTDLEKATQEGKLILNIKGKTITVNPDLYVTWSDSHVVDALFAGFIDPNMAYKNVEEINAHFPEMIATWNKYKLTISDPKSIKMVMGIREIIYSEIIANLNNWNDDYKNTLNSWFIFNGKTSEITLGQFYTDLVTKINSLVASTVTLGNTEPVAIYNSIRTIICSAYGMVGDVYELLLEIDGICNENKGIDPREAATLALVNIVTQNLAKDLDY